MTQVTNPYGGGADRPSLGQLSIVWVIGGMVLGVMVTLFWLWLVYLMAYFLFLAHDGDMTSVESGLILVSALLPFLAAVAVLCFRRTRRVSAGLVMGMAMGSLVLAGLALLPGLG